MGISMEWKQEAATLLSQKKGEALLTFLPSVMEKVQEEFGVQSLEVVEVYRYMVKGNVLLENSEEAIRLQKRLIEMQQAILTEKHEAVGESNRLLGHLYLVGGVGHIAMAYFNIALQIMRSVKGEQSVEVSTIYMDQAKVHLFQKDFKKALYFYDVCLRYRVGLLGEEDRLTVEAFMAVGNCLRTMGRVTPALNVYQRALYGLVPSYKGADLYVLPKLEEAMELDLLKEVLVVKVSLLRERGEGRDVEVAGELEAILTVFEK